MTKPDWKTKPHERKRMTLQQENQKLKERIDVLAVERDEYIAQARYFRDERDQMTQAKDRYAVLRTKDVMVLDGEPKYLKGEDLDKYCDEENSKFWGTNLSSASLSNMLKRMNGGAITGSNPTKMIVPMTHLKIAQKLIEEERYGNDTGSESKEADQKDSGHHTDVLRYADWYGLWKQRST
jgi:phage major head subunit gpT-like protein